MAAHQAIATPGASPGALSGLLLVNGYGEAMTPLTATVVQDLAAIGRLHPRSKAMGPQAARTVWETDPEAGTGAVKRW